MDNLPDKRWLILAVSTFSKGMDEIFHPNYNPNSDSPAFGHQTNSIIQNEAEKREKNRFPENLIEEKYGKKKIWTAKSRISKEESDRVRQWKISVLE